MAKRLEDLKNMSYISKIKSSQKNIEEQKSDFLKKENQCYVCGNSVNTHVESVPFTRFIVEKAQCYNCMTLIRVKNHSLQ